MAAGAAADATPTRRRGHAVAHEKDRGSSLRTSNPWLRRSAPRTSDSCGDSGAARSRSCRRRARRPGARAARPARPPRPPPHSSPPARRRPVRWSPARRCAAGAAPRAPGILHSVADRLRQPREELVRLCSTSGSTSVSTRGDSARILVRMVSRFAVACTEASGTWCNANAALTAMGAVERDDTAPVDALHRGRDAVELEGTFSRSAHPPMKAPAQRSRCSGSGPRHGRSIPVSRTRGGPPGRVASRCSRNGHCVPPPTPMSMTWISPSSWNASTMAAFALR